MKYKHTKKEDIPKFEKFGIKLDVYPNIDNCGVVVINSEDGHHQEFYHKKSTFTYIILEGEGIFFLDDKAVEIKRGDSISIQPNTRIYYKGKLKMVLITTPAWEEEYEVETKAKAW